MVKAPARARYEGGGPRRIFRRSFSGTISADFILDSVDQNARVVRRDAGRTGEEVVPCLTQPTISSSSSHPTTSLPLAAVRRKTTESVVCEVHRFLYVSLRFFPAPLPALPISSSLQCRPVVHLPSFPSSPGPPSPSTTHGRPLQPTSPKLGWLLQRNIASCLCPACIINLPAPIGTKTGVPQRAVFAAATTPSSR